MFMSYSEKLKRTETKVPVFSETQYECDICEEDEKIPWFSETDLAVHKKEAHLYKIMQDMANSPKKFCSICMTLFDSHEELLQHVKSHHLFSSPTARRVERDLFICGHCSRIFFNKRVLEVHMLNFHMLTMEGKKVEKFTCPKCDKRCKMKSLWYHLQYHQIPSLTVCDICLESFSSIAALLAHTKEHPLLLKCDICNFHTTKDSIFDIHLDQHKSNKNINKMTKESKTKLLGFLERKEHVVAKFNIHHPFKGILLPSFMHLCVMCKEICETKEGVIAHIQRDHVAIVPSETKQTYRCTCGADYQSRVLLRHHVFKMKGDHADAASKPDNIKPNEEPEVQDYVEMSNYGISENDSDTVVSYENITESGVNYENVTESGVNYENVTKMGVDSGNVIQVTLEDGDNEGCEESQVIYVYADDTEELVTIEQDSESVIGFA